MTASPAAVGAGRGCDLAILISYSGDGGVERMMNILIAGLLTAGLRVDVLTLRREGGHYGHLPQAARRIELGTVHAAAAGPAIARYLERERPPVLLAAKDRAGWAAIRARARAGVDTRVFVRIGNTVSQALVGRSRLRRWWRYRAIRRLYPHADGIIAISRGVAEDVVAVSGLARERVHVAPNPVVTAELLEQAAAEPRHPWLRDGGAPVVIAVGRLTRQKDFATLLRAFALVRARRDVRLLILGEGEERAALEQLIRTLELTAVVDLGGFSANPYAEMRASDLFVLSSAWEGFGNVLAEALAVGLPVVATDCRSGPREILEDGRHGPQVPVGDAEALAQAMQAVLDDPPAAERQREAGRRFSAARSIDRYRAILDLPSIAASRPC